MMCVAQFHVRLWLMVDEIRAAAARAPSGQNLFRSTFI